MFSLLIRRAALIWSLTVFPLAAVVPGIFAAAAEAPAGPPVDLPALSVTDSRVLPPPESWRYARMGGFEVLAASGRGTTARLVRGLQEFHQALAVAWPATARQSGVPASLILCAKGSFAVFKAGADQAQKGSIMTMNLHDGEASAIVIDLEASMLDLMDATNVDSMTADPVKGAAAMNADDATSGAIPDYSVDSDRQLFREYAHFILAQAEPRPPVWLEEGLVQIFLRIESSPTLIAVGRLDKQFLRDRDNGLPVGEGDFNQVLRDRKLMPLAAMFATTGDSVDARSSVPTLWAKQSYAFVHYCLYGAKGKMRKPFVDFLGRAERAPVDEAMFTQCFGFNYAQMLENLHEYIGVTRYEPLEFRAKPGHSLPKVELPEFREATQAEIGRIKGEALRMAGNAGAAHQEFSSAYIRGERDPQLLASLGLDEELVGADPVRARKLLETAAAAKVVRPRVYFELARMRLAEARAKPAGTGRKLGKDQLAAVLEPLFVARGQSPAMPGVYALIAEAWSLSPAPPARAHLDVLNEGVTKFPGDAELVYAAAQVKAQYGFYADAAGFADVGLRFARDDAAKERFTRLKASLPPKVPAAVNSPATVAP